MEDTANMSSFWHLKKYVFVQLIYDTLRAGGSEAAGFEDCMPLFPQHLVSSRSATWANWIELSGKMAVLAHLLAELRQKTDDRIVLVSNYTQVLHHSHVLY
jgi:DNA repair and recombination RAD54-like protein